jgi:hypothetical protein
MKYLKSDGSADDAYLWKYTEALSGIYVSVDFYICPVTLSSLGAYPLRRYTSDWLEIWDLYGYGGLTPPALPGYGSGHFSWGDEDGLGIYWQTGGVTWSTESWGSISDFLAIASGAHTAKVHLDIPTDTYVYVIDDVTYDYSGYGILTPDWAWLGQFDAISFGSVWAGYGDCDIHYISSIKVGTTDWDSTDIADEDFSGDLSAWSVYGDCSIVSSPSCGVIPPSLAFDPNLKSGFIREVI